MAINKKVLTGFLILLSLLLVISSLSIFQMSRMGDQSTEIKENWVPSMSLISEINVLGTNVPRLINRLGLESDPQEISKLLSQLQVYQDRIHQSMVEYEKLISSDEEKQLYGEYKQFWSAYEQQLPQIIDLAKGSDTAKTIQEVRKATSTWEQSQQVLI